jgi:hypothetical protein
MSNLEMRHLEDGLLLRYLDGELTRRKARQVREHLEACWQCRTELEGLQAAVADCVRYRKNVLGTCLPPPPEPWKDLSRGFDRIDSGLAGESLAGRLLRALMPVKWVAAFAALAVVAGITFRQLRETPSVQAAALLKRAAAVSEIRPHAGRKVRITTRTGQMTRLIGAATLLKPEMELKQMFRAARYDWDDPLSAKSYAQWRDHLAAKQDSVNTVEDRQAPDRNTYEIKTTTEDGDLVAATLKLRMTDFEPIAGRFEFRNRDWVEMTELVDQQTLPASTIAGATGGMPRQPGMPPAFIAPSSEATPLAGFSAELQVVEALHRVGADLGDPVEIGREGRQVLVSGIGISAQRQEQLHALLDPLPNVVLRFAEPTFPASATFPASPTTVQTEPAPTHDAAGPEHGQLQARIEERLGGRPQFERFSGQLLDWTDAAMARAYALRRLAQEFGPASERQMSSGDRRALRTLGREHLAAFARESARIEATLRPILTALPTAPAKTEARADPVAWQPAAEELLSTARRVEALLAVVLGVAPGDRAADNAPEQLMAALPQLTINIEQCHRLLSYDDVKPGK